jgi:hypothetical protein
MVPTIEVANNYLIMPCSMRFGESNNMIELVTTALQNAATTESADHREF